MERTPIGDLRAHLDQTVMIKGWLHVLRDQKKIQFIVLRDKTGMVQITHWKPNDEKLAELVSTLTTESALQVTGKVIDNPSVKLGGLEIQLESLKVEALAESPYHSNRLAKKIICQHWIIVWIGVLWTYAVQKICCFSEFKPRWKWRCASFG